MAWASRQEEFQGSCGYHNSTQVSMETLYKHTIRTSGDIRVEIMRSYPC